MWRINDISYPLVDSVIIENPHEITSIKVEYIGCEIPQYSFTISFIIGYAENPFDEPVIWKRQNEVITLEVDTYYGDLVWSTGETEQIINVSEPGMYTVSLEVHCGPVIFSVEVRNSVELYHATVDLKTNKNKVTWQATPEQAEYITDVKIYRDDMLVGTAPYSDGHFLDEIGSDAAARTYQIVGVSKEGDDCPIASYRKGTIHTTYYEDVDGNLNMTWNTPYIEDGAEGSLTGYQICKYDPVTEEITVVDQINPSITDYTCNSSLFSGGTATIAAIFSRDSRSFSNRNTMLAVNENENSVFKVYPNPSNGTFTVEGVGIFTIVNTLGQTVLTQEIDGETTIDLPKGMYFTKIGNTVRKIVVE
ncbi:MAG: T9SS type A sorting domain-containing protein [Bacteroidales bacterium]|nr:T9SS type A sorting domain-containing protein [Bacteroidales bacterium]